MYYSKKEEDIVKPFCDYANKTREGSYCIKWKNGTGVYVKLVAIEESDNDLEFNDPNYEDFICIVMKIQKIIELCIDDGFNWIKDREYFEFSYHNFPDEIYNSKGELIYKKPE